MYFGTVLVIDQSDNDETDSSEVNWLSPSVLSILFYWQFFIDL